jgi:hypothetical protein
MICSISWLTIVYILVDFWIFVALHHLKKRGIMIELSFLVRLDRSKRNHLIMKGLFSFYHQYYKWIISKRTLVWIVISLIKLSKRKMLDIIHFLNFTKWWKIPINNGNKLIFVDNWSQNSDQTRSRLEFCSAKNLSSSSVYYSS